MKLMKIKGVMVAAAGLLGTLLFVECGELMYEEREKETSEESSGTIRLAINKVSFSEMKESLYSEKAVWNKSMDDVDTNDFILSIYAETGSKIYEGRYGKRPDEINVVPGIYNVKVYSSDFKKPAFDSPVYGDEKQVEVIKDSTVAVTLMCHQTNSAVKLTFSEKFKEAFPGDGLKLKDANDTILYPYSAGDYCYVQPGDMELLYSNGTSDTLLYSRQIPARQMLTLNLSYSPGSKSAIFRMEKDTVKIWKTVNFNAGLRIPTGAVTIDQAKQMIGEKSVTVFGFILGGDVTENTMRVKPPFSSRTSLVLAPDMRERNRHNMFAVELPSGNIREAFNLVDNKEILGSAVAITGNIVGSYYGYPGIKSTKACSILY